MSSSEHVLPIRAAPHAPSPTEMETTRIKEPGLYISLTFEPILELTTSQIIPYIKSPEAGANVLFYGTTRADKMGGAVTETPNGAKARSTMPVTTRLTYSAYVPMAIASMTQIARSAKSKFRLEGIAVVHRLGHVPVGEESVFVGVVARHRAEAWKAGEEVLEEVKKRVEIWKMEEFAIPREEGEGERGVDE